MRVFYILSPLFLVLLLAFLTPFISSYNPNFGDINKIHIAPNLGHLFGTDILGRDLFTRIFYAIKTSFFIGFISSFLTLALALFYVLLARLLFYEFFMRLLDMFLALPFLLLMMFFSSFMEGNFISMVLIIALTHWSFVAKLFANELKRLESLEFYQASLVLGSTKIRAFFRDLLPPCFSLLSVLFVLNIIHAIGTEATLSFFGLGLGFEIASLGNILNEASKAIFIGAWWMVVYPLLALLVLILPLLALSVYLRKYLGVRL
ncbi:ABC transporter permease [Campylobacter helveticus]|uniref:ABC transporter permease n=1 Tax=Campylobacter helveticus TaxID=28898 RepID=A0AAX2UJV9_9BACT|nr:ABC transporter permease [Campylobacter helveticus]ARE81096.1 nickel ABC transporter, permease protein [Campylobacter helveticus]MCR2038910.1 ABC transporter permease [Campylobacter helveticus]MCR2054115.1 ABC transporter permease [Campylobacter helveticus]MCR2055977.1 ABC transporter permease [Campylobacter helveticus]MCR2059978.1 ABC transporter permease [Campylobacter helveticus]